MIINIILIVCNIITFCCLLSVSSKSRSEIVEWHDLKKNPNDLPKQINKSLLKNTRGSLLDNGIHRTILVQDRYGYIYTGSYYPKDDCHKEDCFAVEFLEYGFQGSQFVAKEQIAKWCEFPEEI